MQLDKSAANTLSVSCNGGNDGSTYVTAAGGTTGSGTGSAIDAIGVSSCNDGSAASAGGAGVRRRQSAQSKWRVGT